MSEIDNILFSDKEIYPSDDLIFNIIGQKKSLWVTLMKHMSDTCIDSKGEWNYYNDGKRWLYKHIWKKKTVFWLTIIENTFMVTFWFPDRAEPLIDSSELSNDLKEGFKVSKKYGSTRSLSIVVNDTADIDNVLKLVAIRVKIK